MPSSGKPLRWEDAAVRMTDIKGWVCVQCKRYHGDSPSSENSARYCCHTDAPCACGGRNDNKNYTCCAACRKKHRDEKWAAMPRVDWDGETPLCIWDDDRFFFSVEDLESYLDDALDEDDPPRRLEDMRLVLCEESKKSFFDANDFLTDDVWEDFDADEYGAAEIERVVNDWIASLPKTYTPCGKAVTLESLQRHIAPSPRQEDQPQ